MEKYILRRDNGLISKGERCRDEPRYTYLKGLGNQVDFTTEDKRQAKVFTIDEIGDGVTVHNPDWQFIKVK